MSRAYEGCMRDVSGHMRDVDGRAREHGLWRDGPWRGGSRREWIGGGVVGRVDGSDGIWGNGGAIGGMEKGRI